MKLSIEELDILIRNFVRSNRDYLTANRDNMYTLPEVIELFKPTGWTLDEYQELCKGQVTDQVSAIEQFATQMNELGYSVNEIEQMILEVFNE